MVDSSYRIGFNNRVREIFKGVRQHFGIAVQKEKILPGGVPGPRVSGPGSATMLLQVDEAAGTV